MSAPVSVSPLSRAVQDARQNIVEQARANGGNRCPIAFIENKFPDFQRLEEVLQVSRQSGQWTNFGPVSLLLDAVLENLFNLHPSRAVVMCSSGTAALLTLVALKNYRAGRRLRWVVSAYGFRSSCLGLLADARIVDCNERGLLDLDVLAALDPQGWDGVVLTNVFGLCADIGDYIEFCRERGKELILDNAGLLLGFPRQDPLSCVDEILSFHQTKPWGMGEGGCAVVARDSAELFRQFTNMGQGLEAAAREGASNSKISDFASALILQRLLDAPQWMPGYQAQARRVLAIALEIGLRPLAPLDLSRLSPPHLPLLAVDPVSRTDLENDALMLHKYYEPLSGSAVRARRIYDRIVNVPCHPGIASLRDEQIRDLLAGVTSGRGQHRAWSPSSSP